MPYSEAVAQREQGRIGAREDANRPAAGPRVAEALHGGERSVARLRLGREVGVVHDISGGRARLRSDAPELRRWRSLFVRRRLLFFFVHLVDDPVCQLDVAERAAIARRQREMAHRQDAKTLLHH